MKIARVVLLSCFNNKHRFTERERDSLQNIYIFTTMETKLYHTTNTDHFNWVISHCSHCTWIAFIHDDLLTLDFSTILENLFITTSNILFHHMIQISLSKENFNLYIINHIKFMHVETPHGKFVYHLQKYVAATRFFFFYITHPNANRINVWDDL